MKDPTQLPGHEQAAAFWVGALIATQAIAVYVEPDRSGGPFDVSHEFDHLPARPAAAWWRRFCRSPRADGCARTWACCADGP